MIVALKRLARRALAGIGVDPSELVYAVAAACMGFFKIVDRAENRRNPMVNIGGSRFYKRHWMIMDHRHERSRHYDFAGLDYDYDLMSGAPFPFADDSVRFFYSSNTLEHVLDRFLPHVFAEMHRCLRPGGAVRIQVPDFTFTYDAMKREDYSAVMNLCGDGATNRFTAMAKLYGVEVARRRLRGWPETPKIESGDVSRERVLREFLRDFAGYQVGKVAYDQAIADLKALDVAEFGDRYAAAIPIDWQRRNPHEHCTWFDGPKLVRLLGNAGFSEIEVTPPFASRFDEMRGVGNYWSFDHRRSETSVYVEAVKGTAAGKYPTFRDNP